MHTTLLCALLLLQCFHVLFLLLHDWLPLGALNDIRAVRSENPLGELLLTTLVSTAPFLPPLLGNAQHLQGALPGWVTRWIAIAYGILLLGELRAWWIPYFFGGQRERVERYRILFGRTHAFLPARNGIRVNTLHVMLHMATVATLLLLAVIVWSL